MISRGRKDVRETRGWHDTRAALEVQRHAVRMSRKDCLRRAVWRMLYSLEKHRIWPDTARVLWADVGPWLAPRRSATLDETDECDDDHSRISSCSNFVRGRHFGLPALSPKCLR